MLRTLYDDVQANPDTVPLRYLLGRKDGGEEKTSLSG